MSKFLAEEYIAGIPMWTRKKNPLSDIRKFMGALDVSEENIIHVAGTNGKGSVCAYLGSILKAAGYRVGTFVSPHLSDVKERFLLDGEPVCEAYLQQAFDRVLWVVGEECREGLFHPSYFEFCFLIAMELFTEKDVDIRILETGLGGRLDATNAVRAPLACVITSISHDHMQYLGDTIEEIASEKAGIIKPHVPVIFDASDKEAARVIYEKARALDAPAHPVCPDGDDISGFFDRAGITQACTSMTVPDASHKAVHPVAPYKKMNAALAATTLMVLDMDIPPQIICEGLLGARWQGRMEEIRPGIWLDGAHNPGGISAFIEAVLAQEESEGPFRVHLLFAAAADKDYRSMISLLAKGLSPAYVTVTQFDQERAADAAELAGIFKDEGCSDVKAVSDPYKALLSARAGMSKDTDRLYIIGSLYLVGALRPRLL